MAANKFKINVISNTKQITQLLTQISFVDQKHQEQPFLYLDLEGKDLSREGTISILTLLLHPSPSPDPQVVYLVDIHRLGAVAFDTPGSSANTLRNILEDERISKVFFDVRNDADALFKHYGVKLQGVEDVQLMESASRKSTYSRRLLNGLARCIEDLFDSNELKEWKRVKNVVKELFTQHEGVAGNIFEQRPLPNDVAAYCAGDVQYLPQLWRRYILYASENNDHVRLETAKRVEESMKPGYQPHGSHKALAPWSTKQNKALDALHNVKRSMRIFDELDDDELGNAGEEFDTYFNDMVE